MAQSKAAVTTDEAARMLGVSKMTISRLIRDGELDGYQLTTSPKSPYRIYVESIQTFLKRRKLS